MSTTTKESPRGRLSEPIPPNNQDQPPLIWRLFFQYEIPSNHGIVVWVMELIDYVKRDETGLLTVCEDHGLAFYDYPLIRYLNRFALERLSTVEATLDATRQYLAVKAKTPLYLNSNLILIQVKGIRSPEAHLINYFAVSSFSKFGCSDILVSYKNGHTARFHGYAPFVRQWRHSIALSVLMDGREL